MYTFQTFLIISANYRNIFSLYSDQPYFSTKIIKIRTISFFLFSVTEITCCLVIFARSYQASITCEELLCIRMFTYFSPYLAYACDLCAPGGPRTPYMMMSPFCNDSLFEKQHFIKQFSVTQSSADRFKVSCFVYLAK